MKIDSEILPTPVNQIKNEPIGKNLTAALASEKFSRSQPDKVELSKNGLEIEQLKKTIQEVPDIRIDRVAQLKMQIDAGTYKVDGKAVAEKMLQSWREIHRK